MRKIDLSDIKNIIDYEKIRQSFRSKIIAMKDDRRLKVGDMITLTFENRYTVVFQIEEMMRIERIVDEEKIKAEVDTYNELIPNENELSATLFVEVDEQDRIKPVLDSLVGLNRDSVYLQIDGKKIPAVFEEGHATDDRISAVQYVRFKLTRDDVAAFEKPSIPIRVIIEHQNYKEEAILSEKMREAIRNDVERGASANVWNQNDVSR